MCFVSDDNARNGNTNRNFQRNSLYCAIIIEYKSSINRCIQNPTHPKAMGLAASVTDRLINTVLEDGCSSKGEGGREEPPQKRQQHQQPQHITSRNNIGDMSESTDSTTNWNKTPGLGWLAECHQSTNISHDLDGNDNIHQRRQQYANCQGYRRDRDDISTKELRHILQHYHFPSHNY